MAEPVCTPGLRLIEHEIDVPLDHDRPDGPTIRLFAREVADAESTDRPYLVFFQGGPGMESPRPGGNPLTPGWLGRALQDYRVLMLDQRGTGRSTPIGSMLPGPPAEQADHLACFRADSIVRDAELLRQALGVTRWSVLGQSFGGFCVLSYLSLAPDGLREAFVTGGVPPLQKPVDDVYRATYRRMLTRNARYYRRYPADRERVRALLTRLDDDPIALPGGDLLTARRFRQAGNLLGMSDGIDRLHYLLELPWTGNAFAHDAAGVMPFARNPVYAVLHEACYADGGVTGWSAERVMPPEYEDVTLFTGEHVFPWMLQDFGALRPLAGAAQLLAGRDWPRLYDDDVLGANQVPCAATVYAEDPYVEAEFSLATAERVRGMRAWLTNEYDHNALRADGARVLSRLIDLARGRA